MSAAERELYQLLEAHGFELSRSNGHQVYKNPNGKTLVLSNTPSAKRWAENAVHDLKNLLGIGTRGRNAVTGERREKHNHHEQQRPFLSTLGESPNAQKATFQEQLGAIILTLFNGVHDEATGKLTIPLTPELEALKEKLQEMIFAGLTLEQIAERVGGLDKADVSTVIVRLFGKGIREIRKELQPVKPITTKELDYGKLELLIRAGYSQEKIAEKIDYSSARLVALCKKYWDKTPQELRFEWADSTYETLLKAKVIEESAANTPTPPTSQTPVEIAPTPTQQFGDKEYPCSRCPNPIRLSAAHQRAIWQRFGDKAAFPKLCGTCKKLINGEFRRILPGQIQDGDRVIECLGCGNQILFTRKQQDEFVVKGWEEPRFCRECRTRSVGQKARNVARFADIEAHFLSQETLQ